MDRLRKAEHRLIISRWLNIIAAVWCLVIAIMAAYQGIAWAVILNFSCFVLNHWMYQKSGVTLKKVRELMEVINAGR